MIVSDTRTDSASRIRMAATEQLAALLDNRERIDGLLDGVAGVYDDVAAELERKVLVRMLRRSDAMADRLRRIKATTDYKQPDATIELSGRDHELLFGRAEVA
jgi:hypothetical protein